MQEALRESCYFMLEHLFPGADGLGLAEAPPAYRTPGGHSHRLFTACSMGMASPRGVQGDPGMRPIILLGLVMEPEASCTWETKKKHQSQRVPFILLEQVKGLQREAWLPVLYTACPHVPLATF